MGGGGGQTFNQTMFSSHPLIKVFNFRLIEVPLKHNYKECLTHNMALTFKTTFPEARDRQAIYATFQVQLVHVLFS